MTRFPIGTTSRSALFAVLLAAGGATSCKNDPPAQSGTAEAPATGVEARTASAPARGPEGDDVHAEVGKAAPDFTLRDLDGKDVQLSAFKGKTVVLEWFNPGCPFVEKSHTLGSLKDAARRHVKDGVVWLAINSAAPGKQGNGVGANRDGVKKYGLEHPVLLDESGKVGKTYGATNTPHLFVIDDKGTLIYRGAVDNSPDGEGGSPTGGKLVSYVEEAIGAAKLGKAPPVAETKAYGCSVKYGN